MKARAEEKEIVKRALAMLHSGRILDQPTQVGDPDIGTDIDDIHDGGSKVTPETLAASILPEATPDEVGFILKAWEGFGIHLDRKRVSIQLEELRRWQSRWRATR